MLYLLAQIALAAQQPPSAAKTEMEKKLKAQKDEMERQLLMSAQEILQQRIVSMTTLDVNKGNTTAENCKYDNS